MKVALLTLVIILSITTLILSYPRLMSSYTYIPVQIALTKHWKGDSIKIQQFPQLIETTKKAIEHQSDVRYWIGLGWLQYLYARKSGFLNQEGKELLNSAQQSFEKAVSKSPASPEVWLRLAWIHSLLKHDNTEVVNTLKMSIYTGRAERYLIKDRLELALEYADYFEKEDKSLLSDQIQLAWRFYKRDMLKFIKDGTYNINTISKLLTNNPQLKKEITVGAPPPAR